MLWSCQVYIIHRSITGFLVVQEAPCTHAHEYRLLGASCLMGTILIFEFQNLKKSGHSDFQEEKKDIFFCKNMELGW